MRPLQYALITSLFFLCTQAFAEGPQAYYPFNGNANDYSGFSRTASVNGATLTTDHTGTSNRAYSFNGSNQWISCPYTQPSVSQYSIAAWFKTSTSASNKAMVSCRGAEGSGGKSLTLCMGGPGGVVGRVWFGLDMDGVAVGVYTNASYNNNTWHHVVGTWAGSGTITSSQFKLYIDGVQAATSNASIGSTSAPLGWLGHDTNWLPPSVGSYFPGSLDEIGIYTRMLTGGRRCMSLFCHGFNEKYMGL